MKRALAICGSLLFLLVVPGTVVGLVPWWISRWRVQPPLLGIPATRGLGVLLIAAGLPGLFDSFARFALQGLGTPAPVYPTNRLVVSGLYRYVRNPMYVSVESMIVGQALLLGGLHLWIYAALAGVVMFSFVLIYEEPTLRRTFGDEYEEFCNHVPRWIPRLRPWPGTRQL